jgi:2-polyprenyl-3-methyl-5-hydroxy-6-metoxy-1,4-benzoquinol methylase
VDQTDPASIEKMWSNIDAQFDVIIDDGLHEFEANHTFLLNSHHKLKPGGIYIIEDILNENCAKFGRNFDMYKTMFQSVSLVPLAWQRNALDNNILILIK